MLDGRTRLAQANKRILILYSDGGSARRREPNSVHPEPMRARLGLLLMVASAACGSSNGSDPKGDAGIQARTDGAVRLPLNEYAR
jgi:hypothetical protein